MSPSIFVNTQTVVFCTVVANLEVLVCLAYSKEEQKEKQSVFENHNPGEQVNSHKASVEKKS